MAHLNFSDVPLTAYRLYFSVREQPNHGSRTDLNTRLTQIGNLNENTPLNTVIAAHLRSWCELLDISAAGNRTEMAQRIVNWGVQGNSNTNAVTNPREVSLIKLGNHCDPRNVYAWLTDITLTAQSNGYATVWENLLQAQTDAQKLAARAAPNPAQAQQLTLLYKAARKSLSATQLTKFDGQVTAGVLQGDACDLVRNIKAELQNLTAATQKAKELEFSKAQWRGSKMDLQSWLGVLREMAGQFGPHIPAGIARETKIRDKLMAAVSGDKDKGVDLIMTNFGLKDVDEVNPNGPDYTNDELVKQLMREISKQENQTDAQSETFGVFIAHPDNENANTGDVGQGGPKGGLGGDPSTWQPPPHGFPAPANPVVVNVHSNNPGETAYYAGGAGGKYCWRCANFWKDKGMMEEKRYVWENHNAHECKFAQPNKNNPQPTSTPHGKGAGQKKTANAKAKKAAADAKKKKGDGGGGKKGGGGKGGGKKGGGKGGKGKGGKGGKGR